jgi:DNA-directed RNA polymerase subunit RPC12/RpoP
MYKCYHCGETIKDPQKLERVVCPHCGFRIFYKVRQPVLKRVKAL